MLSLSIKALKIYQKRKLTKHLSTNIWFRIVKLIVILVSLVLINTLGMIVFEKMSFGDALWLSSTTVTTVGYGDFSPSSLAGRLITVITMYGFAITVVSLLAAEIIDWRLDSNQKKLKGLQEWKFMNDHIQIINAPNYNADAYLTRLVTEIKNTPSLREMPIQLLTHKYPEGLPYNLRQHKLLHRTGSAEDNSVLHQINLDKARYIIILARDPADTLSDSLTFDILSRVVEVNSSASIVAEAVQDENRQRFIALGATAVLRPVRAYPEMIVRALTHPGTEKVLEDLFATHGDSLHSIPCVFTNIAWKTIVIQCLEHNIGTPLAYSQKQDMIMHPEADTNCTGDSITVLVKEHKQIDATSLQTALKGSE